MWYNPQMPYKNQNQHREQIKAYQKEWEARNRDKRRGYCQKYSDRLRDFINNLKSESGCSQCPEKDWRCLDFHHRNPSEKTIEIVRAVRLGWGRDRIQKEVDKCDVLCANCHRKFHRPA